MDARDVLLAYLHDPPDKALAIAGHVARARRYLAVALGDVISENEIKDPSDPLAAVAERLPAPSWQRLKIDPVDNHITIHHPLQGSRRQLRCEPCDEAPTLATIEQLVKGVDDTFHRFLLIWRALPERLAEAGRDWFLNLPADTRVPDHTIWHHLDTTAGLKAAEVDSGPGAALLSFSLGPVQMFIAAARTVRDLWSGSMLLSWMTFKAMLPIVEEFGPTAFVYPSLRGLPWLDMWFHQYLGTDAKDRVPFPPTDRLLAPCLPNRFLALVPWGVEGQTAARVAVSCREAAATAWKEIANAVRQKLQSRFDGAWPEWDRRWDEQVASFFDVRTAVLPWRAATNEETIGQLLGGKGGFEAAFPEAVKVRKMAAAIPENDRPHYAQNSAGSWQAKVELSARLMQSLRTVRHIPPGTTRTSVDERFPPKCSLLGSYEQMGPDDFDDSAEFWRKASRDSVGGVRLRERERLSAVSLVKRFSGPCFFQRQLQLERDDLRYDDTATVAAAEWLERSGILPEEARKKHDEGWSGQWLHWPRHDFDPDDACPVELWQSISAARKSQESPPAYYAILTLDGDEMGRWLRGEKSPQVRRALHDQLVDYFQGLDGAQPGLDAHRPLGPAMHAALSEALANFAIYFAPMIVEKHKGTLIYAGGDDVLALLPTSTVLQCAAELQQTIRREWWTDESGRERLLLGSGATVSAGLAIVHYKEDLQFALQTSRDAEQDAKKAGRDALQITACRRSGEHASALCPWEFTPQLEVWVRAFLSGPRDEPPASNRWAYRLSAELPTLTGMPVEAMCAEIRRQVMRSDRSTQQRLQNQPDLTAPDMLVQQFQEYHKLVNDRRRFSDADALEQFVTLCKTAAFLARGRDE